MALNTAKNSPKDQSSWTFLELTKLFLNGRLKRSLSSEEGFEPAAIFQSCRQAFYGSVLKRNIGKVVYHCKYNFKPQNALNSTWLDAGQGISYDLKVKLSATGIISVELKHTYFATIIRETHNLPPATRD